MILHNYGQSLYLNMDVKMQHQAIMGLVNDIGDIGWMLVCWDSHKCLV